MSSVELANLIPREHEVFTEIVRVWPEWQRCQHGKQCVTVWAHWSDDAPFTVTTGQRNSTQVFRRDVHVDGSVDIDALTGQVNTFEYGAHSRCPECGAVDTLDTKQLQYGDETTCRTEGCGYRRFDDIGD